MLMIICDIGQIPVSLVQRIEYIRGPRSAVYGSGAIGGVVNIITMSDDERAQFKRPCAFAKIIANASNTFSGTLTVTVDQVLINGNLHVVGEKQIAINQGTEFIRHNSSRLWHVDGCLRCINR